MSNVTSNALSLDDTINTSVSSTSTSISTEFSRQILGQLSTISQQLHTLDGRVRKNESALEARTSHPVPATPTPVASFTANVAGDATSSHSASNYALPSTSTANARANVAALNPQTESDIVPSLDFLKTNAQIQAQVDARVLEYQNAQVTAQQGKLKSQRGGVEVPVKKSVGWPQNFVLIGKDKRRPTYDQLSPTLFMAGCIKGALRLPQPDKDQKLNYLAKLLEDASDFSFEGAKACHAVVLTSMECDELTWQDTNELNRHRRQHAQRHPSPDSKKQNKPKSFQHSSYNPEMVCKYFLEGTCKHHDTHVTKGTTFKHFCKRCRGDHADGKCKPKPKN